jgi:hypothetical protein
LHGIAGGRVGGHAAGGRWRARAHAAEPAAGRVGGEFSLRWKRDTHRARARVGVGGGWVRRYVQARARAGGRGLRCACALGARRGGGRRARRPAGFVQAVCVHVCRVRAARVGRPLCACAVHKAVQGQAGGAQAGDSEAGSRAVGVPREGQRKAAKRERGRALLSAERGVPPRDCAGRPRGRALNRLSHALKARFGAGTSSLCRGQRAPLAMT